MTPPELPESADVVIIGGGHNGLACAAYLARGGREVVVLEARGTMGGCASTVDAIGARVNICNCDHTMVLASGIVNDLDLADHGLTYLDVDPVTVAVGWDGTSPPFIQWRSIERTIDGLARVDPRAAAAYRAYLDVALPAARLMLEVQRSRPGLPTIGAAAARRGLRGSTTLLRWARSSVLEVMTGFGLPPWMIAAVATSGPAVWGLPPNAAGTGLAALGPAVRHLVGVGRPVGGSGALPAALAAAAQAHGARLITDARVGGLTVRGGRVLGVRLADGRSIAAPSVVAAVDPRTVLLDWLPDLPVDEPYRQPPGEGYESKLDAVVTRLPELRVLAELPEDVLPAAARGIATALVCPTPEQQIAAADARARGEVSDPPMFLVNTPSVLDPTMRPDADTHLLSLEVLWTPYALAKGWTDSAEPWSWLERLGELCEPGLVDSVRDWRVVTPEDYERDFGLARGYAPSYPGSVVATLLGRRRELSRYRTAVDGLYLTGAGTFPGAGVWGASGRNAAATVLSA
ncbi:phytoene desaturase family protein [uncultured Jatrophihabitans sp.]|uniref:phytoene desaturase family protein n=1 Tax=uncultured Jatrophihabitans sp. TaxID=1610747 RepID=UPI0035CC4BC2